MIDMPAKKTAPYKRGPRGGVRAARVPKYDPSEEATAEDIQQASAKAVKTVRAIPTARRAEVQQKISNELPKRIEVKPSVSLRSVVPGSVWKQGPFKWEPTTFACESEKLNERFIEPRTQNESLLRFMKEPDLPIIYGVTGNPDDAKAKLFAAYLVQLHQQRLGLRANVVWHVVYGGFDNPLLKEYDAIDGKAEPSMLVISNLTPNSPGLKLDKTRDLLERFENIPRIVCAAGEDPLSFLTTRLYSQINALAYFSESLVKKKVEII
jgi:hypothetical protein